MPDLPNSLALTTIADDAEIIASAHRNNYTAISTAVNALITALSGGSASQVLLATDTDTIAWGGGYTAYTPTWTSSGTAPAVGNASVTARYVQIGKLVHAYGKIIFGTTTTYGTGTYSFALPVTAGASVSALGAARIDDASSGNMGIVEAMAATTSTMQLVYGATYLGTATTAATTAPWTWASSDTIQWNIVYEAA